MDNIVPPTSRKLNTLFFLNEKITVKKVNSRIKGTLISLGTTAELVKGWKLNITASRRTKKKKFIIVISDIQINMFYKR